MTVKHTPSKTQWTRQSLLLSICLLAFALRVAGLAAHNIWWDEGIGVWLTRMPLLESIRWTAGDVHPPLYYIVLHLWWRVAGEGEFVLRFPSVLFSLLTIPLIYRLGKAIAPPQNNLITHPHTIPPAFLPSPFSPGVLAALFLTLSRFAVIWAQEIRMYALSAFLSTGALWAAVNLWHAEITDSAGIAQRSAGIAKSPPARWSFLPSSFFLLPSSLFPPWWWAYIAFTLGSLYTLYLTITVPLVANLGFLGVWWLARRPRQLLWRWASAQLTIVVLYIPWLLYALPQMHGWNSDSAFSPAFFVQLYTTMLAVGTSLNLQAYLGLSLAVFAVLFVGLGFIVRARPNATQAGALTMLLSGLLLPAVVVAVISLPALRFYYSRPLVPRYLLPLSACFYTLLAWGIGTLATSSYWRRALALVATLVVIVAALVGLREFYPGRARRDDYATIAHILNAHRHTGDTLLLYVDRDWPIFVAHYDGPRVDIAYGQALDAARADVLLAPLWAATSGVWLVTTPLALQTDPQQALPQWLAAQATAQHTFISGENALTFYARTAARADDLYALAPGFTPSTKDSRFLPLRLHKNRESGLSGAWWPLPRYRTGDTLRLSLYWTQPPRHNYQVSLVSKTTRREVAVSPLQDAVRQSVDIPLTPDLLGGRYALQIQVGPTLTHLGDFTLVHSVAGASVAATDIVHPVNYQLGIPQGSHIHLIGYDLPRATVAPGDYVELTLYWQAPATPATRYKVFTHLLGETYNAASGNFLWGQQDNEPGGGQALTTLWSPGAVIVDAYRIPLAPHAPPGTYTLEIGMYGLVDIARLPATDATGENIGDVIFLTSIAVQLP